MLPSQQLVSPTQQRDYLPDMSSSAPLQQVSNHDLVTPVLDSSYQNMPQSRNNSMNIRMFRRKGTSPSNFDEDMGADLQNFTNTLWSMNDLTHLRDPGRYNTTGLVASETAPVIPMVGAFDGNARKGMNNLQYREYMNHQKNMNLAQSARAMSLAGGGYPMGLLNEQTHSFQNGPYDRTMSLGYPDMNTANARAMSLNSNIYLNQQSHPQQVNGPGPNGMRPNMRYGPSTPQYPAHMQNAQHTMSLRSNGYPPQRGPPMPGSRTNSMGMMSNPNFPNNSAPYGPGFNANPQNQNQFYHAGQVPHASGLPRAWSMEGASQWPMYQANRPGSSPPSNNYYGTAGLLQNYNVGQASSRNFVNHSQHFDNGKSTDSLMNVLEEDEEELKHYPAYRAPYYTPPMADMQQNASGHKTLAPPPVAVEDGDHGFRFEDSNSPQLSRKSTLRKANSKRVRKLDLFSSADSPSTEDVAKNRNASENGQSASEAKLHFSLSKSGATNPSIRLKSLTANTVFNNFRSTQLADQSKTVTQSSGSEDAKDVGLGTDVKLATPEKSDGSGSTNDQAKDSLIPDISEISKKNASSCLHLEPDVASLSQSYYSLSREKSKDSEASRSKQSYYSLSREKTKDSEASTSKQTLQLQKPATPPSPDVTYQDSSDMQRRGAALSRSNSEMNMLGLLRSSSFLTSISAPCSVNHFHEFNDERKEKRKFSASARRLIKRLSISSHKEDKDNKGSRKAPLLSKVDLAMMNCNNELQNELQLVTSELAMSIKRELALENQLRSRLKPSHDEPSKKDDAALTEKVKIIAELQEKLNNERRLRLISNETAFLAQNGQVPSALKLSYEKNEIYKQLLAKNDLVTQLEESLRDMSMRDVKDLLHKYNELVKENSELKTKLSEVETRINFKDGATDDSSEDELDSISKQELEKAQISSLRMQRDELREMIVKLTVSKNAELKVAQERIKTLEETLEKANSINAKLSKRINTFKSEGMARNIDPFAPTQGGKLQGLSIVSPTNEFFDCVALGEKAKNLED